MRLIHALALIGLAVLVPAGNPGCSKYGEGSICDVLNNDPQTGISNDCEDGLICTQALCADTAICCPPPGHNITSPACSTVNQGCGNGTGGSNSGGATTTSLGGFGGSMEPQMCPHDECVVGVSLIAGFNTVKKNGMDVQVPICSQCVNDICNADSVCCTHAWDPACVDKVATICKHQCSMNTGGGGAGGSSTPTGGGGAGGGGTP